MSVYKGQTISCAHSCSLRSYYFPFYLAAKGDLILWKVKGVARTLKKLRTSKGDYCIKH